MLQRVRVSRDFGIDSSGKTAFFWWRTGIPLKASGFQKLVWEVQPDGSLSEGTSIVESSTPVTLRVTARHFPSDAKFILSGHGLYRNNVRGHITTMGSAAYGTNLVNAVEGLKAWRLGALHVFLEQVRCGDWSVAYHHAGGHRGRAESRRRRHRLPCDDLGAADGRGPGMGLQSSKASASFKQQSNILARGLA